MMDEKVYQNIYDELSGYMKSDFSKLVVYLEYGENSYSFSFYLKKGNEYIKCYDLEGVSESDLEKTFTKIDSFVVPERAKEKHPWSTMTMIVDKDGNMHADFDYTDLSNGTFQYKKEWKKRYLNKS